MLCELEGGEAVGTADVQDAVAVGEMADDLPHFHFHDADVGPGRGGIAPCWRACSAQKSRICSVVQPEAMRLSLEDSSPGRAPASTGWGSRSAARVAKVANPADDPPLLCLGQPVVERQPQQPAAQLLRDREIARRR